MLRPEKTKTSNELLFALREVGSRIRRWPERCSARRRARDIRVADRKEVRANYGRLGSSNNPRPIGGEIKYLHLCNRFPEFREDFNLIYLVSSALPPQVVELVRIAKARGAKLVWNQNGIAYPGFYGDFYPWFNRTMAELLQLADHVIYQSRFCRESAERYLGKAPCTSEIFFNPVDTEKFRPREGPLPTDAWELLCAGTNHSFYRIKAPLKALKILRQQGHPARLTIAGEFRWPGGEKDVARCIHDLGLDNFVSLRPPFTQNEAPSIYQNAHVLVHGKDKDPCPTVPIEAMACGLPVVGLDSGGMPELVASSAGRLVPVPQTWTADHAADPADLAKAVEQVMQSRESYAEAARRNAEEKFDVRAWLNRHGAIFKEVLAR
jgi:glycosyltransferase involved in cell wall biosynthesis